MAQENPKLVPQWPDLGANRTQVASVGKDSTQLTWSRITQYCFLQIVQPIRDLLQHWEDLVKRFIDQIMENIIEIVGIATWSMLLEPLRELGKSLSGRGFFKGDQPLG